MVAYRDLGSQISGSRSGGPNKKEKTYIGVYSGLFQIMKINMSSHPEDRNSGTTF